MELSTLLLFFAILICPISMGMMWEMNKNMDCRPMMFDRATHGHHIKKNEV